MPIIELQISQPEMYLEFNSILNKLYKNSDYINSHQQIFFPSLITTFVIKNDNMIEARIALYHSSINHIKFFGNFEALNIASGFELLEYAINYLKNNFSISKIVGPLNGLTWLPYRFSKNSENTYFKNDICNPIYYNKIVEMFGFTETESYYTNIQTVINYSNSFENSGFKVGVLNHEELISKGNEIYEITMNAFKNSPYFNPLPFHIFENLFKLQLKQIQTDISPFIFDKDNQICAYSFCFESEDKKGIVVKTIARKSERKYAGLGRILSNEINKIALEKNYQYLIHAFMHQGNNSKALSEKFNGKTLKTYSLYQYLC